MDLTAADFSNPTDQLRPGEAPYHAFEVQLPNLKLDVLTPLTTLFTTS